MKPTGENHMLQGATYFLAISLFLASSTVNANPSVQRFDKILQLDGVTFHVTCPNEGSLNDVTIVPAGLQEINTPITIKEADGSVTGAEVADLNKDGSPEIYIYVASAGSGSYGSLIAYSANNKKSLSQIHLSSLEDDEDNSRGYMGHDKFFIRNNHLARSFPIYQGSDSNANPTGGTRTLEYKLVPDETTWQLKLVKRLQP